MIQVQVIPDSLAANGAFSRVLPGLQLVWDSTSMGLFKQCPRKYYYSIILGWTPFHIAVDLEFGLLYHAALERYDHDRASGISFAEAKRNTLRWALETTWNVALGRPWESGDSNKNRFTLLRTLAWYLDKFRDDPLQTIVLESGKPAVELTFRFPLDYGPLGEAKPFELAGHLDRVVRDSNERIWINDRKTTRNALDDRYFENFSPDNQMSLYDIAGQLVLPEPISGLMIDAAEIKVNFSRFERRPISRTEETRHEWQRNTYFFLRSAETCASQQFWPQNDKNCFRCDFRSICAKPESTRALWASFKTRKWDPTEARGDI